MTETNLYTVICPFDGMCVHIFNAVGEHAYLLSCGHVCSVTRLVLANGSAEDISAVHSPFWALEAAEEQQ
jgi:hypothetical protein